MIKYIESNTSQSWCNTFLTQLNLEKSCFSSIYSGLESKFDNNIPLLFDFFYIPKNSKLQRDTMATIIESLKPKSILIRSFFPNDFSIMNLDEFKISVKKIQRIDERSENHASIFDPMLIELLEFYSSFSESTFFSQHNQCITYDYSAVQSNYGVALAHDIVSNSSKVLSSFPIKVIFEQGYVAFAPLQKCALKPLVSEKRYFHFFETIYMDKINIGTNEKFLLYNFENKGYLALFDRI